MLLQNGSSRSIGAHCAQPYVFEILLVLLCLGVSTLLFARYYPNDLSSDQLLYRSIAEALLDGRSQIVRPSGAVQDIGEVVTPGYSLVIAGIYAITGAEDLHVYLVQLLFFTVSILIFYRILRIHVPPIFALAASIWLLVYYPLWRMSFQLLMEVVSVFLLLLTCWTIAKYLRNSTRWGWLLLASLIFGVLVFVNNRFIVHAVAFSGFLIVLGVLRIYNIPIRHAVLPIAVSILLLTPWHVRQYQVHEQFVIFAPQRIPADGSDPADRAKLHPSKVFRSYDEYVRQVIESDLSEERKIAFLTMFTVERYETLRSQHKKMKGYRIYLSRLVGFWEVVNTKVRLGYGGDARLSPPYTRVRNLTNLFMLGPVFLLSWLGAYYAVRRHEYFFVLISVLLISHWLLHSYVHYIVRYRELVVPLMIMLATYALAQASVDVRVRLSRMRIAESDTS